MHPNAIQMNRIISLPLDVTPSHSKAETRGRNYFFLKTGKINPRYTGFWTSFPHLSKFWEVGEFTVSHQRLLKQSWALSIISPPGGEKNAVVQDSPQLGASGWWWQEEHTQSPKRNNDILCTWLWLLRCSSIKLGQLSSCDIKRIFSIVPIHRVT